MERKRSMLLHSVTLAIVALLILFSTASGPARAATFTCISTANVALWGADLLGSLAGFAPPDQPICTQTMLSGEIASGDASKLEALLNHDLPFMAILTLNSSGGSLNEAMQIGRLARKYYLTTEAPFMLSGRTAPSILMNGLGIFKITPGATCASACFFAWLGGVDRSGDVVAIHRPFPSDAEMQRLSPADAGHIYHDLSDAISAYMVEMEAQPHWLTDMMRIQSNDIYMIPYDEFADQLMNDVPSFAQWIYSKCGGLTKQQHFDHYKFMNQKVDGGLSKTMSDYRDFLNQKSQDIMECRHRSVILSRWQLRTSGARD